MPRAGAFNKINMWDRHAASSTCLRQYFEKGIIRMPQAVRGRKEGAGESTAPSPGSDESQNSGQYCEACGA